MVSWAGLADHAAELDDEIGLDKNRKHTVEVVVDRLSVRDGVGSRLADSLETALELAREKGEEGPGAKRETTAPPEVVPGDEAPAAAPAREPVASRPAPERPAATVGPVRLGAGRAASVARRRSTSSSTRSTRRNTSAQLPPPRLTKKLACFSDTWASPRRNPFSPADSMRRAA